MRRELLTIGALLCALFFNPFSAAAQSVSAFDDQLDPNVRIDLLENGINPGFTSVPEIDRAKLMESVVQFQAANGLPVTGRLDEQTLAKVNIHNPKSDTAGSVIERAKPSQKDR